MKRIFNSRTDLPYIMNGLFRILRLINRYWFLRDGRESTRQWAPYGWRKS